MKIPQSPILTLLYAERARMDAAIAALEAPLAPPKRRGRPPMSQARVLSTYNDPPRPAEPAKPAITRAGGIWTPERRAEQAKRMKKIMAKKRKQQAANA